jgi:hypothetical protein
MIDCLFVDLIWFLIFSYPPCPRVLLCPPSRILLLLLPPLPLLLQRAECLLFSLSLPTLAPPTCRGLKAKWLMCRLTSSKIRTWLTFSANPSPIKIQGYFFKLTISHFYFCFGFSLLFFGCFIDQLHPSKFPHFVLISFSFFELIFMSGWLISLQFRW